jgi:hypothetical protein
MKKFIVIQPNGTHSEIRGEDFDREIAKGLLILVGKKLALIPVGMVFSIEDKRLSIKPPMVTNWDLIRRAEQQKDALQKNECERRMKSGEPRKPAGWLDQYIYEPAIY